jgi:hypothetical protein
VLLRIIAGVLSAVVTVPAVASGPGGYWVAQVVRSGGIRGEVVKVTINSERDVIVAKSTETAPCSAELSEKDIKKIEAALERSHPDTWRESYALDANPTGCCDQFRSSLSVGFEATDGRLVQHHTYWFTDSPGQVPHDLSALYEVIWQAGNACAS